MAEASGIELNDNLTCKNCGLPLKSPEFRFCPRCGTSIPKEKKIPTHCVKCGTELKEEYIFCPICGNKIAPDLENTEVIQTESPKSELTPKLEPSETQQFSSTESKPSLNSLDTFVSSFSTNSGLRFGSSKQYGPSKENIQMKPGTVYKVDETNVAIVCPHDSVIRSYTFDEVPLKSLKIIDRKGHSYVGLNSSYIEQKYLEAYIKTCWEISPPTDISKLKAAVNKDSKFYIGLTSSSIDCYIAPSDILLQENKSNSPAVGSQPKSHNSKETIYCDQCGNRLKEQDRFCGKCGARVGSAT